MGIAVAAVFVVLILQGVLFYFCCRKQLAALISHRRQMKGREVKEGDVDLADDPESESGDRATSLHNVRTRDTTNLYNLSHSGARTRSSIGDTRDAESSVSPYFDPTSASRPMNHDPFDTPPEDDFAPPFPTHWRHDSLSSSHSGMGLLNLNLENSDPTLSLPQFNPTGTPSSPNSATNSPRQPLLPYPSSASNGNLPASSSKAHMAALLSAQNPDHGQGQMFGGRQPRPEAPAGGFRLHQDAGRANEDVDVEELPPVYRPEWETESQRDRRGSDLP